MTEIASYRAIAKRNSFHRMSASGMAESLVNHERQGPKYGWMDSRLDSYPNFTPNEFSFWYHFRHVLPDDGVTLKNYIEETFPHKHGRAIGLELGGTGSRLFGGFTEGFFAETRSINLTDYRKDEAKSEDRKRRHDVIPGNILDWKSKRDAEAWLNGRKVDVLFERLGRGRSTFPYEPFTVFRKIKFWYELLADDGLLFAEMPIGFSADLVEAWKNQMMTTYKGKFEIQTATVDSRIVMRLQKFAGAPQQLIPLPLDQVVALR